MPYSHHSHSGQFCNHAQDKLEAMLAAAEAANFSLYSLTEHCQRGEQDLYPGEAEEGYDRQRQTRIYDDFVTEATRLRHRQEASGKGPAILIGFEAEWIRDDESPLIVQEILEKHKDSIDFFVGSVHFVKQVAIDFDRQHYERARDICGGTDESLFSQYFDDQYNMLETLKPQVVGHFDLIRLMADEKDPQWDALPDIWPKILRNLDKAKQIGAVLELNTSALRKGLAQPYPRAEICRAWLARGGDLVLSDDAHAVGHVGTNYTRALALMEEIGLQRLGYLSRARDGKGMQLCYVSMDELKKHPFWKV